MHRNERIVVRSVLFQDVADLAFIPDKHYGNVEIPHRLNGAEYDLQRSKISAHRINRYFFHQYLLHPHRGYS